MWDSAEKNKRAIVDVFRIGSSRIGLPLWLIYLIWCTTEKRQPATEAPQDTQLHPYQERN